MTVDHLRTFCLQMPGSTEDVKWEHLLCFLVGNKIFCTCSIDETNKVGFKVAKASYEEWTNINGISPAPYFWKASWVRLEEVDAISWSALQEAIVNSYELVKATLPKRLRENL